MLGIEDNMMNARMIEFQRHGDDRGMLVAIEQGKEIPFEVKRVYYIFDTKHNVARGFHAHKQLEQMLICVKGSCKVRIDNGNEVDEVLLDSPMNGLYISGTVWREMYDFSEDAVLLVLASNLYDEDDYIRDYRDFIEYVSQ